MPDDSLLVVEVVPDVTGIDKSFDYSVPPEFSAEVEIGSKVRVDLNGRRVGGWVVRAEREIGPDFTLKSILKWSGLGPDADLVEVCRWAAVRWCVPRLRPFLVAASPPTMVARAAPVRRSKVLAEPSSPAATDLLGGGGGVLRLPPTADQLPAILSAARVGPTLVVCASADASRILFARLKRAGISVALMPGDWSSARGGVDVVIGARSAAFAPCPGLAAGVILDEHEDSLQEERMPTWHAREILAERCRRVGAPLLVVSPCPTAVGSHGRRLLAPPIERERAAWSEVEVIDRSDEPPWNRSLLSSRVIAVAREESQRLLCIVNTKGVAKLLGCRSCQALIRCERCESTMSELNEGRLDCTMCSSNRPRVCSICSSTDLVRLRPGITRLRDELERAANRPVGQIEANDERYDDSSQDVFIGTSAALTRLRHIDVVAFLDFDRELLAPRFKAHEQAMSLLVRASRLVGPRKTGGRVLVQTSLADHDVVRSAVEGNGAIFAEAEMRRRKDLNLPPFSALALVEGEGLSKCEEHLSSSPEISVARHRSALLLRAPDHRILSEAWLRVPMDVRSSIRIEVDPISM